MPSEFKRADKLTNGGSSSGSNSNKNKVYVKKFTNTDRRYKMLVMKVDNGFSVLSLNSSSGSAKQYAVRWNGYKWVCTCPDYSKHGDDLSYTCKHIEGAFMAAIKMSDGEMIAEVEVNGRTREKSKHQT